MHPSASLLLEGAADALVLVSVTLNVVMLTRDEPLQLSGLTLRQRLAARYRRHPRLFPAQFACAAVGLLLAIAYGLTFLV